MLDFLPDDLTIAVAEYLPVLDILRSFRTINKRHSRISRLPVIWARVCRDYSILAPAPAPVPTSTIATPSYSYSSPLESRIASIAHLSDHLHASEYQLSGSIADTITSVGEYPSAIRVTPGGKYAVIACQGGLAVVDVRRRNVRVVRISPAGYDQPFCVGLLGTEENEKVVVAYETAKPRAGAGNNLDICEILQIDVRTLCDRPSTPVSAISLARTGKITALALSSSSDSDSRPHPSRLLALGWNSQVDLHDFVTDEPLCSLHLPGRIRDITFAGDTIAVLHSDPPQISVFLPQIQTQNQHHHHTHSRSLPVDNFAQYSADLPKSDDVDLLSNRGSPIRFATSGSPICSDDSTFIFIDARNSRGNKLSRCVIGIKHQHHPHTDLRDHGKADVEATVLVTLTCSAWSSPTIFGPQFFDSPEGQGHDGGQPVPIDPARLAKVQICASSICGGSHHIISHIMATHATTESPLVHTRMRADGELVSTKLRLPMGSGGGEGGSSIMGELSGADSPMAWDEQSGRLFIVRSGWSEEWEVRNTLVIMQL